MFGVELDSRALLGRSGARRRKRRQRRPRPAPHVRLVGRYADERRPFSAIALHAETSALTAIANDYPPTSSSPDRSALTAGQVTCSSRSRRLAGAPTSSPPWRRRTTWGCGRGRSPGRRQPAGLRRRRPLRGGRLHSDRARGPSGRRPPHLRGRRSIGRLAHTIPVGGPLMTPSSSSATSCSIATSRARRTLCPGRARARRRRRTTRRPGGAGLAATRAGRPRCRRHAHRRRRPRPGGGERLGRVAGRAGVEWVDLGSVGPTAEKMRGPVSTCFSLLRARPGPALARRRPRRRRAQARARRGRRHRRLRLRTRHHGWPTPPVRSWARADAPTHAQLVWDPHQRVAPSRCPVHGDGDAERSRGGAHPPGTPGTPESTTALGAEAGVVLVDHWQVAVPSR